jgi:hypothetical protein
LVPRFVRHFQAWLPDGRPRTRAVTQVVDIIDSDLNRRRIDAPTTATLDEAAWLDVVHRTYYPPVPVT